MAKPRSHVLDYFVYLAVRVVVAVLQILPFHTACRFAEWLAWLAYHLNRRHRQVADDNLRFAFPQWSAAERDRVVRAVYRHFCTLLVEIIHIPRRVHAGTWHRHLELVHGERVVGALLSKRPVLIVTGHFGNWEMAGYALGLFGFRTFAIARELDNPYLDRFLRSFRERTGQGLLAKNGEFERIQSILASGGVIATLADQDAGQRGQLVEFFGRPASTHKAVALMALEYGALMVVTGSPRVGGPLEYQCVIEEVIDPEEYRGRPDVIRAITQRYTAALERLVRRHPEQYFWLHRRWKHQPKAKAARKVA